MRFWGATISTQSTVRVSGRPAMPNRVSAEPRPMTATASGRGWSIAGSAPSTVWYPP